MALAAISVDLDSLPHYCRIFGLPETLLDERARTLVAETAVRRFLDLFSVVGIKGTFFAIGEDLEAASGSEAIARACRFGVEIANHSYHHDYALSRKPLSDIREDVRRGADIIERCCGVRPKGFRAPGYTLSSALYQALSEEGVGYDSSAFPAVPYYGAKAAVMGALSLVGRPSRSVLDSPKVLLAPTSPYFPNPNDPYARGDGKVFELPISVSPGLRLPFIGIFVHTLPLAMVRATYATMKRTELFNFELHGVDVLGPRDGIPEELVRRQRDLGLSAEQKMDRLSEIFRWLKRDFDVVTLGGAAESLARPAVGRR